MGITNLFHRFVKVSLILDLVILNINSFRGSMVIWIRVNGDHDQREDKLLFEDRNECHFRTLLTDVVNEFFLST